jgi:hypothetical protein
MRIEVRRQDAFPGTVRRRPLVVETDDLEPALARELESLAARLPAGGPGGRGDLMRYDVLVDDASGRRTASYFEPDVPAPVRALLELAGEAGRRA